MCRDTSGILSVRVPRVSVHLVFDLVIKVVFAVDDVESLFVCLRFGASA